VSTIDGTRGGVDMSSTNLRVPRTKFCPPVSTHALSTVGFVAGKFVGRERVEDVLGREAHALLLAHSSRPSSTRPSTHLPVAR
jgi:hypothetical protein